MVSEIGTRGWKGEQRAAAVVAAEEHTGGNLERLLLAHQDTNGVLGSGAWRYCGELFQIWALGYSCLLRHIDYEVGTNLC